MLLRVQDREGRGPYRPGLSERWVDAWRTSQLPPIYEEVPSFVALVNNAHREGLHIGCAVRGLEAMLAWFSPMELMRLHDMGFGIVDASACEVLMETKHQLVIGSKSPLRDLPAAHLEAAQ